MPLDRRSFLTKTIGAAGVSATGCLKLAAADPPSDKGADFLREVAENERVARSKDAKPTIGLGDKLKHQSRNHLVKPRWLFLKIHTNAEPIVEGRVKTVDAAIVPCRR